MAFALRVLGESKDAIERLVSDALETVGLANKGAKYPRELSGGEQQRVAIARALVPGPRLIAADEPTGNLDSASGADLVALLQELNRQGTTLVIITHNHDVAAAAGRQIELQDGRVVADRRR